MTTGEGAATASPISVLSHLKAKRAEVLAAARLVLPVPRWDDPQILVTYKPIDNATRQRGIDMVEKATKRERSKAEVNANCDALIAGCTAVQARIDGKLYSLDPDDPDGEPTVFDERLAAAFELDLTEARAVVKALFITEFDIFSHASALIEFSGLTESEAEEAAGEA